MSTSSEHNWPLIKAVLYYKNIFEELTHLRRANGSSIQEKRLVAKLSRIRKNYFGQDGGYHLADTIRAGFMKTLRRQ